MKASRAEWLAQQKIAPVKVLEYHHFPLDNIKANWNLYAVTVQFEDGRTMEGSMQGHPEHELWAYDTFEADE